MAAQVPALTLDKVTVRYGRQVVLHDVSHRFASGVTVLLGSNGAGKTTLIRAICGLVRVDSGRVSVDGKDVYKSTSATREFRAHLGWMPQSPALPRRARITDVVRYAAWLKGVDSSDDIDRAATTALATVDLSEGHARRIGTLSGGQQRRVALACALVAAPSVVMLDEPTTGLDPQQRDQFLRSVKAHSVGRVVLVSTHLMEDVLKVADQIIVLSEGTIVRSGSIEEIAGKDVRARASLDALRRAAVPNSIEDLPEDLPG